MEEAPKGRRRGQGRTTNPRDIGYPERIESLEASGDSANNKKAEENESGMQMRMKCKGGVKE